MSSGEDIRHQQHCIELVYIMPAVLLVACSSLMADLPSLPQRLCCGVPVPQAGVSPGQTGGGGNLSACGFQAEAAERLIVRVMQLASEAPNVTDPYTFSRKNLPDLHQSEEHNLTTLWRRSCLHGSVIGPVFSFVDSACRGHGFTVTLCADDTQIYGFYSPDETSSL